MFMTDGILLAVRRVTLIPDSLRARLSCIAFFFFPILEYSKAYEFPMRSLILSFSSEGLREWIYYFYQIIIEWYFNKESLNLTI